MSSLTFLVLGYGIPEDISQDENYQLYLKSVFNKIFAICSTQNSWDPVIVFSGGKTDLIKPYRCTEAGEMIKVFRGLMQRASVKKQVRSWRLISEGKSLSTLDNLLYTQEIVQAKKLQDRSLVIFGEKTRDKRISVLAKKVFGKANVQTIDFDQSPNRYLDANFLHQKEVKSLKFDLWALKDAQHLKEHRALFKKRLALFRQTGLSGHVDKVREWWERELVKASNT